MTRGPKKHMKRLNAPSHWMLDKLGGIFVSPSACLELWVLRALDVVDTLHSLRQLYLTREKETNTMRQRIQTYWLTCELHGPLAWPPTLSDAWDRQQYGN